MVAELRHKIEVMKNLRKLNMKWKSERKDKEPI